jgi:hypothetical protein
VHSLPCTLSPLGAPIRTNQHAYAALHPPLLTSDPLPVPTHPPTHPCRITVAGQQAAADSAKRMIEDIMAGIDPFRPNDPYGGFGGVPGVPGAFPPPYGGGFPGYPPFGGFPPAAAPFGYGGGYPGGYGQPDPYAAAAAAGGYGGAYGGPGGPGGPGPAGGYGESRGWVVRSGWEEGWEGLGGCACVHWSERGLCLFVGQPTRLPLPLGSFACRARAAS